MKETIKYFQEWCEEFDTLVEEIDFNEQIKKTAQAQFLTGGCNNAEVIERNFI